ncbi:MAG TPA: serine/threonine protein kinase [Gemmataceae bacterium]|nr:serine/threonine protein kinase [Gemmataceae bacterium]
MSSDGGIPFQPKPVVADAGGAAGGTPASDPTEDISHAALQAAMERVPPQAPEVAGYRLHRKLGEGTYGKVWLAEEERTGVRVAIKFLAHGVGQRWQFLQNEVKQLALLHADPGIVQLEDFNPDASPPYYVMRYAEGGSLAQRLEQGPLDLAEAGRIFRQVAEALAYVHAKGIRHCDLKPGNVLFDARGRALLADFGQAHLAQDASPALGTFFYMAPEQADLNNVLPDTRWDVYGLGSLFYAMLTGGPPREDPTLRDQIGNTTELSHRLRRYREMIGQARRPDGHRRVRGMDRPLAQIIDRCLEVDPGRRWRDAGAVLDALRQRASYLRRRPILLFGFLAPLLLILATVGIVLWSVKDGIREVNQTLRDKGDALAVQQQKNDRISARLIARVFERELQDRIDLITSMAQLPKLRQAMKEAGRREPTKDGKDPNLRGLLGELRADQETKFVRWCLADRQGYVPAIDPFVEFPAERYHWREWFNGEGNKADKEGAWEPLRRLHVSAPYISTAKDHRRLITISAPIPDPDEAGRAVGVLMASFDPTTLKRWTEDVETNRGAVIILDRQGHYLLHPHMDLSLPPDEDDRHKGSLKSWLGASPLYAKLLTARQAGVQEYTDPVDHRTYRAGYAPLADDPGWGVVVCHEPEQVEQLQGTFRRSGVVPKILIAVIVQGVLVAALWVWLWRMLRRPEEFAHG